MTTQTTAINKVPGRKLIPGSETLDERETAAVKAVKSYESLEKKIRAFESEHADVFSEYYRLTTELEAKRKVADAAIRATDASFGPWERFSEKKSYDVPRLFDLIGEEKFLELGGTVDKAVVYNFDREALELNIAARKIPKSVVAEITTVTPNYRAPKPHKAGASK